jgi:hypothetical protein
MLRPHGKCMGHFFGNVSIVKDYLKEFTPSYIYIYIYIYIQTLLRTMKPKKCFG